MECVGKYKQLQRLFFSLKVELFILSVSLLAISTVYIQEIWYGIKISFVIFHLKTLSEIIAMATVITAAVL